MSDQPAPQEQWTLKSFLPMILITVVAVAAVAVWAALPRSDSNEPTAPAATAWTSFLTCPDCEDVGMEINLWDSPSRGRATGSLPHGTRITIEERRFYEPESRYYYLVRGSERGWVPEDFIVE